MAVGVRPLGACAVAVAVLCLGGCALGPTALSSTRLRYNEAVRDTWNEEFLLNIVRLRYLDPIGFDAVSNILSTYTWDTSINETEQFRTQFVPPKVSNNSLFQQHTLGASGSAQERPTITFLPLEGAEFTRSMLGPIHVETLINVAETGWDVDRLLRVSVQEMNHVENVKRLIGPLAGPPRYEQFNALARQLEEVHRRGLLEFAYEDTEKPLSEPTHFGKPGFSVSDLMNAADQKAQFHKDPEIKGEEPRYTLWGKEHQPVLRLAPPAWNDAHTVSVAQQLSLVPGLANYRLILGGETGQLKPLTAPGAEIIVNTRSAEGVLLYVSKAVEVPVEHLNEGLVHDAADEAGQPFDWSRVMGDLIRIHSQKMKPKHAFVATKYRGYWFYIDDDDLNSKRTFALVLTLTAVELAGGIVPPAPLVVVPAGGGGGGGGRGG
jgi:hypothetical protein